jgi:hypothetical protein
MELRMRAATRYLIAAGYLVMILAGGAVFLASRHFHVYSMDGLQVYGAMGRECHPVWEDYNFRRIRAGDDVEVVIARTNPITLERKGRWLVLGYQTSGYFTGITAVAYDGKMVFACAWSCSWTRLFFDELTEEQSLEFLGRSKKDPRWLGIVPVYRS